MSPRTDPVAFALVAAPAAAIAVALLAGVIRAVVLVRADRAEQRARDERLAPLEPVEWWSPDWEWPAP